MAKEKLNKNARDLSKHRMTIRLSEDEYQRAKYWADREGESVNDFVRSSIIHYVSFKNHDFGVA